MTKKPPFTWTDEDRSKLVPGCAVVRVTVSWNNPDVFHASLLNVVKVYGDSVFFRARAIELFEDPGFFEVPIASLDPDSITSAGEIEAAERGEVTDGKVVH